MAALIEIHRLHCRGYATLFAEVSLRFALACGALVVPVLPALVAQRYVTTARAPFLRFLLLLLPRRRVPVRDLEAVLNVLDTDLAPCAALCVPAGQSDALIVARSTGAGRMIVAALPLVVIRGSLRRCLRDKTAAFN